MIQRKPVDPTDDPVNHRLLVRSRLGLTHLGHQRLFYSSGIRKLQKDIICLAICALWLDVSDKHTDISLGE